MGRDFGSSGFEDHRGASTLPWGGCRVNRFALPRAFPGVVHSRQWMCTQRRGCWIRRVRGIYDLDRASDSVDQLQAQVGRLDNLTLAGATADDVRAADITAATAHPAPGSRHPGAGYCWRRVNQPTRRLHSHTTPRYRFGDTNRISSRTMRATSEVFE